MGIFDIIEKHRVVVRAMGSGVVLAGMFLLVRLLHGVSAGSVTVDGIGWVQATWGRKAVVLALRLPVPLHVMSVGLMVQKRWLPPAEARAAWVSVVISGCWLGVALAVRLLLLEK
jgi:hypothetical protein